MDYFRRIPKDRCQTEIETWRHLQIVRERVYLVKTFGAVIDMGDS